MKQTIDYVPQSQSRVWKVCRNLSILWAFMIGALYFATVDPQKAPLTFFWLWAVPASPILAIGLCFKS